MIARGIAIWPKLNKADKFNEASKAEFKTKLRVTAEAAEPLIEKLTQAYEANYKKQCADANKPKLKRADFPWEEEYDESGELTGNYVFRFKLTEETNDGVKRRLPLVDAKKQPMNEMIGGGSELNVVFDHYGWHVAAMGAGLTLKLVKIQVISLSEGGGGVDELTVEDGFETTAAVMSKETEAAAVADDDADWE